MKLTYEQYFGDNVTLFNRETKQKNPSQTKLDLMYTPIPLITIGASYRQGEGHTETQFLTNLNYKFGIPLSAQLSPNNVASMRTLIGSRHDLVERNNYIILDHKKREKDELYKLDPISGYGQQEITVNAPIRSYANIKDISWSVPDKAFKENDGKLTPESGRSIIITLPSYQETHKSDYELDVLITDNQGRKQTVQTKIKVVPFSIDEKVNITSNDKNGYTFSDPIITYRGAPSGEFVKNASINKVTWITDPPLGDESGLEFTWKNGPAKTNDEGKLADEEGNLILNTLISKKAHEKVVVYIQLDGAPRQEIGTVVFNQYHVNYITVEPAGSLLANDKDTYTYTAHIVDQGGHAVPEGTTIAGIKWGIDNSSQKLTFVFKDGEEKAGQGGTLIATLRSTDIITDIGVSLSVEEQAAPTTAERKVSFQADPAKYRVKAITVDPPTHVQLANDKDIYTYTAHIVDQDGHAVPEGTTIAGIKWEIDNPSKKLTFTFKDGVEKAGQGGTLIAMLRSADIITDIGVSLSVEGQAAPAPAERKVSFQADPTKYTVKAITVNPQTNSQLANGQDVYTYTAHIVDQDDHAVPAGTQIANIRWSLDDKDKNNKNLHLRHEDKITGKDGILTATLSSSEVVQDVEVLLAVEGQVTPTPAERVSFKAPYTLSLTVDRPTPQNEGEKNKYTFTATVRVNRNDSSLQQSVPAVPVTWNTSLPVPDKYLITTHEDTTNDKGKATFTMYSKNGGFDDITVTASVKNSDPATADKTVSITAIPQNDDTNIIIRPYNWNGQGNDMATVEGGISANDLTFGWDKLTFQPFHTDANMIAEASRPPVYISDNESMITAHQGQSTILQPYFRLKTAGNTTVKTRWNFPSGRYLLYKTDITIKQMVFSDIDGYPGPGAGSAFHNPIRPANTCTVGWPVQLTEIKESITNLVSKGSDLKTAGLAGEPSVAMPLMYVGANGIDSSGSYTQAYPLLPTPTNYLYIMLCQNNKPLIEN